MEPLDNRILDNQSEATPQDSLSINASDLAGGETRPNIPAPRARQTPSDFVRGTISPFVQVNSEESRERDRVFDDIQDVGRNQPSFDDQFGRQLRQMGTPDAVNRLRDVNSQLTAMNTQFDLGNVDLQGAAGQEVGALSREVTQNEKARAVRSAGLAAESQILQGNIETAQSIARDAVNFAFQDRKLELDQLEAQYDALQDRVSGQEAQVLDQRRRELDEAQRQLERVESSVEVAVASGAATPSEMDQLTGDTTSDEEKIALAQSIVGRVASQDRELERQKNIAQMRSAQASANKAQYELGLIKQAAADRAEAIESGALLPEQAETIDKIDKEFRAEPVVKAYNEAVAKRFAFDEVISNGVNGVQDLILVYDFMKSVDPTSVVRESEFDNAAKSGNIFSGQYTKFNEGYFGEGGQLPPDVKESFLNAANASYQGTQTQYFNVQSQFGEKVDRRLGIDGGVQYLLQYQEGAPANRDASADPENAPSGSIIELDGVRYRKMDDGNLIEI